MDRTYTPDQMHTALRYHIAMNRFAANEAKQALEDDNDARYEHFAQLMHEHTHQIGEICRGSVAGTLTEDDLELPADAHLVLAQPNH